MISSANNFKTCAGRGIWFRNFSFWLLLVLSVTLLLSGAVTYDTAVPRGFSVHR